MYFVLPRTMEMLDKANSAVVILSDMQNSLFSAYWWMRKDWKEKDAWVALSFTFLLCHNFHICENCLVQGIIANKKGYNSVLWLLGFLRMPLLFFCIGSKILILMQNVASQGYQHLAYSVVDVTSLLFTLSLILAEFPGIVSAPEVCDCGPSRTLVNGTTRTVDARIARISSAPAHILLSSGFH